VVITIIGILGTLVVLRVSGLPYEAMKKKTISDLKTIIQAAEIYRATSGRYPESLAEMKAPGLAGDHGEPLLRETVDSWGREYIYEINAEGSPLARCLGRDGLEGGEKENQDFEEPAPAGN
jgi:general secretion pathway protein G